MKCVECKRLQSIDRQQLPGEQRQQLRSRSPDSFVWLQCGKDAQRFSQEEPQVFEQVVSERRCSSYASFDASRSEKAVAWPARRSTPPKYVYAAIVVLAILIALTSSAIAIILS